MDVAFILKTLWKRRTWVAAGVLVAVLVAWAATFKVSFPPTAETKTLEYGAAWTQILIDARRSPLFDIESSMDPVASRAEVYVRLVDSEPVRQAIASESGYLAHEIVLSARTPSYNSTRAAREPASEQRSRQIATESEPKRVLFTAESDVPMISVFAQAGTPADAMRLADASARGLIRYLESLDAHQATPRGQRIEFRQLGSAEGELVNPGASKAMALMVLIVVFTMWCIGVVVGSNLLQALRAPRLSRACLECGHPVDDDARFCPDCGGDQHAARLASAQDAAPTAGQHAPGPRAA